MAERKPSNGSAAPAGIGAQGKKRSRPINDSFLRPSASIRPGGMPVGAALPTLYPAARPVDPDASVKLVKAAKAIEAKRKVQSLESLSLSSSGAEAKHHQHQQQQQQQEAAAATSSSIPRSMTSAAVDVCDPIHIQQVWRTRRTSFLERCLPRIQTAAATNELILQYGDQLALCLRYLIEGTTGELRQRVLASFEPLMSAWHEVVARQVEAASDSDALLAVIQSIHNIERCGRAFAKKRILLNALRHTRSDAVAFFGWDPEEGPPLPDTGSTAFRKFTNALVYTHCAQYIDADIGCRYMDVLQWLPGFRPYRSVLDLTREEFIDQLNLVYYVVMTNTGWGKTQLMRELFPHEWGFLTAQLPVLAQAREINMTAKCVRALRLFHTTDDDPNMQQGLRLILGYGLSSGLSEAAATTDEGLSECIAAAEAMSDCSTTAGFGPVFPDVLRLLLQWAEADILKLDSYRQDVVESQRIFLEQPPQQQGELEAPIGSSVSTEALKGLMVAFRTNISQDFIELGSYLERSTTPGEILSILQRLDQQNVTLELLSSSRVAKRVKRLSDHHDARVAELAQAIVIKWQDVVRRARTST